MTHTPSIEPVEQALAEIKNLPLNTEALQQRIIREAQTLPQFTPHHESILDKLAKTLNPAAWVSALVVAGISAWAIFLWLLPVSESNITLVDAPFSVLTPQEVDQEQFTALVWEEVLLIEEEIALANL